MVDKNYCMSSFLMFRYVFEKEKSFCPDCPCNLSDITFPRVPVKTCDELLEALHKSVETACQDGDAALALSGGIDSAILAKLMPKGSKAYTFRCIVPGKEVTDESFQAAHWAELCGLEHHVIDIYWEDLTAVSRPLMMHKGAPIHSIEGQIYLAALQIKKAGMEKFIFGENADIIFGGMDGLLAKNWLFGEFVERYSYVMPYKVLRAPEMILSPYRQFEKDGHIDGHEFINTYFRQEALGTYNNACETAGVTFVGPYSQTYLDAPIDYNRIRKGETKYLIREVFKLLYPNEVLPAKIPMPRPMNEWMAGWSGPVRPEFLPHCTDGMTGDQKWMVWILEQYLTLLDEDDPADKTQNKGGEFI